MVGKIDGLLKWLWKILCEVVVIAMCKSCKI